MPITHLPLDSLLSSTGSAGFSGRRSLSEVNVRIAKARKVLVVSGAGISCSSGIPDFRSADGLYSLVKARYPDAFVTGKELFSSGLFANPDTQSIFFTFIAELFLACQSATPTRTHHFIRRLEAKGKLLRSYTQNVDGFERRIGIESGGRGAGLKKIGTRNVELHGDLGRVRCVLCYTDYEARVEWVEMFRQGEAPECPACMERCDHRLSRAARATPIGCLRPSIVLYDEPHPLGDQIADLQMFDMRRRPDVLLVMGTSLKVHGLKRLIKDFATVVRDRKGIVVFVNATPPTKEWDDVIDYHIQGETDTWVEQLEDEWRKVRPQDWERQTLLDGEVVHASVVKNKSKGKKALDQWQLPTPPASQQSPKSSEYSFTTASSPLTPLPSSSPEASPSQTPMCPPTPVSPSKRGRSSGRSQPPSTHKKTRFPPPTTPVPARPGKGNLFAEDKACAKSPPLPRPLVKAQSSPVPLGESSNRKRSNSVPRAAACESNPPPLAAAPRSVLPGKARLPSTAVGSARMKTRRQSQADKENDTGPAGFTRRSFGRTVSMPVSYA